jgi:uncharacterized protein (TIGR02145 family)
LCFFSSENIINFSNNNIFHFFTRRSSMNYKKIFNVVGVVAVSAVLFVGCAGDNNPPNEEESNGSGGYVEKGNDISKYKTVTIGTQTWMAENLDYNVAGSICYKDSSSNCAKYGRLYTWDAARNACPSGWHLPTDAEWTTLTDYIGGASTAGTKLKATYGWNSNGNGTDEYGFSALPGGIGSGGLPAVPVFDGSWWSATEAESTIAYARCRIMYNGNGRVDGSDIDKRLQFSVRCVQD